MRARQNVIKEKQEEKRLSRTEVSLLFAELFQRIHIPLCDSDAVVHIDLRKFNISRTRK